MRGRGVGEIAVPSRVIMEGPRAGKRVFYSTADVSLRGRDSFARRGLLTVR